MEDKGCVIYEVERSGRKPCGRVNKSSRWFCSCQVTRRIVRKRRDVCVGSTNL